jgi:hypothetical protein
MTAEVSHRLPLAVTEQIEQLIEVMAGRLASPSLVEACIAVAARQAASDRPRFTRWQDHSLAQGYSGLALLFGHLDYAFPQHGWDQVAHDYLRRAVAGLERLPAVGGGLWGGVAGVALAADVLSRGGQRYVQLSLQLDAAVMTWTRATADELLRYNGGVPVARFDVISGLVGVGRYLLGRKNNAAREVLLQALAAIVALTGDEVGVPRWFTPPEHLDAANRDRFPHGNLNCGLAHGMPGLLAFLALAELRGMTVQGGHAAIRRLADWLAGNRQDDQFGPGWPTAVDVDPERRQARSRDGWCYGAPGVARALWLAGQAIRDRSAQQLAVDAMKAVFGRPAAARNIDSPTFCHGVAGLLGITSLFARDCQDPCFVAAVGTLTDQLISLHEPDSLLGYRSRERARVEIDQPGLLDGAPGVLLALMVATGQAPADWGRPFLLC